MYIDFRYTYTIFCRWESLITIRLHVAQIFFRFPESIRTLEPYRLVHSYIRLPTQNKDGGSNKE